MAGGTVETPRAPSLARLRAPGAAHRDRMSPGDDGVAEICGDRHLGSAWTRSRPRRCARPARTPRTVLASTANGRRPQALRRPASRSGCARAAPGSRRRRRRARRRSRAGQAVGPRPAAVGRPPGKPPPCGPSGDPAKGSAGRRARRPAGTPRAAAGVEEQMAAIDRGKRSLVEEKK